MNISALWIKRPVMTILVMFGLLFFGIVSYLNLPINNLPAVDFPTIQVTASLPGASPETMASNVAKPLEKHFSTIQGLQSMSSTSYTGSTTIILQFSLERNIDACAQDVNSKLAAAQGELPGNMPSPPTYDKVNPSDQPIMYFALTSEQMPLIELNDYAENYLGQNFTMVNGVSQVIVYGQKFAARVQVNPKLLANMGLGIDDVAGAIQKANVNLPGGTLDGPFQAFTIDSNGQLMIGEAYREVIVAYQNGRPVKVKDIGDAISGIQNDKQSAAWYISKGKAQRAIVLAIKKQPGSNTVKVADGIEELMPRLKAMLPESVEWHLLYDASDYIKESIDDIEFTLVLTIFIVLIIVFLFLRSFRSTIIPNVAVPLSIIGTFAVMSVQGFSLNNLSMMALVLCVGLVVDDAIVVLENIVRRMEMGESPMDASYKGSQEIGFTIMSMTLSLVVVFIPILFMPGIVGKLFHEFAVCIAAAILISGFISLTLTPMMCSRILKEMKEKKEGRFYNTTERIFEGMVRHYGRTLRLVLVHRRLALAATIIVVIISALLFMRIPKGFLPSQDQNFMMAWIQGADKISFDDMVRHQEAVNDILMQEGDIKDFISVASLNTYNSGIAFAMLKNMKDRKRSADEIVNDLRPKLNSIPGVVAFPQNPPPIQIGAGSALAEYQFTLQSSDLNELYRYALIFEEKMRAVPGLVDVNSDVKLNNPKLYIEVDRDKASALGLSLEQIQNTFFSAYASRKISTIYGELNQYYVILEVQPRFKEDPSALSYLYVKSNQGKQVPLGTVAHIIETLGPLNVNHTGQLNSATVAFNLKPGHSIGEAVDATKKIAGEVNLPQSIATGFQGSAQEFEKSFASMGFLLFVTVLVIYMVLGILYESFIHPITILSALPLAACGALVTLWIFGMELDMYGMVGMIMLIGIAKKNGIMMVDFALEAEKAEGLDSVESIHKACMIRFRPIMMTTMAALFGTMPIALGIGAGGDARQPMGVAVVGGLFLSQLMTLYITPVFYVYFDELSKWLGRRKLKGNPE
ncbi:MAG TPA: efflux RND transporter permease subunit [Syntrophorhabdaceae bacterium]|nr:efflux RND transporter permease subunit [Syntrophorhabdaceae bacterium]HQM80005.1 efflux RND transporter permease subunit [Syntrophorhabdaceae bacterium]